MLKINLHIKFFIFLYVNLCPVYSQTTYGCEIGWRLFGQYCYRVVDTQTLGVEHSTVTFDAGLDYCRSNGASLVSITNAFENTFIQTNLTLVIGFRYWIGLQIHDQQISWIDGSPYSYTDLNTSTIIPGEFLSAYLTPGQQWIASQENAPLEGRICKRPAIPNMPAIHNGSALGFMAAHDPTILKTQNGQYIVYMTNNNIPASISNDRQTFALNGTAFPNGLPWTVTWTKGAQCTWTYESENSSNKATTTCLWAPDTSFHNGTYYMYYAASTFGSKISAIGLATSSTGLTGDWQDQGEVMDSTKDSWNDIDPNLLVDDDGKWYLTFGSWSSGIWQYEVEPNNGMIKRGAQAVQLANGRTHGIEASGLVKKGNYYYLMNSIGICCQGVKSTYIVIVGRSTSPQGPFVDKAGTPMTNGGGSELLVTEFPIVGPGGQYVYVDNDPYLIVYHYYDGLNNGKPRLAINYLGWTDDGWPYVY